MEKLISAPVFQLLQLAKLGESEGTVTPPTFCHAARRGSGPLCPSCAVPPQDYSVAPQLKFLFYTCLSVDLAHPLSTSGERICDLK